MSLTVVIRAVAQTPILDSTTEPHRRARALQLGGSGTYWRARKRCSITRKDLVSWDWLHAARIDVGRALANLVFPRLAKVRTVEAGRERINEFRALTWREPQRLLERAASFIHLG